MGSTVLYNLLKHSFLATGQHIPISPAEFLNLVLSSPLNRSATATSSINSMSLIAFMFPALITFSSLGTPRLPFLLYNNLLVVPAGRWKNPFTKFLICKSISMILLRIGDQQWEDGRRLVGHKVLVSPVSVLAWGTVYSFFHLPWSFHCSCFHSPNEWRWSIRPGTLLSPFLRSFLGKSHQLVLGFPLALRYHVSFFIPYTPNLKTASSSPTSLKYFVVESSRACTSSGLSPTRTRSSAKASTGMVRPLILNSFHYFPGLSAEGSSQD